LADAIQPHDKSTRLEGQLEDFPLTDILQVLQVSGKIGASSSPGTIRRPGSSSSATGTSSSLTSDSHQTLGDRLVRKREVTSIRGLHEALAYRARYPGCGSATPSSSSHHDAPEVEIEVKEQMTEAIEQMIAAARPQFVFRIGLVSLMRAMPDFTVDLILDEGVEPRHILLEASLLQTSATAS